MSIRIFPERAFDWLNRGVDEYSYWMELIAVHHVLDPLRGDGRFAVLLSRMNLAVLAR